MISGQIREMENHITNAVDGWTAVANWLQEIAYQLAVHNERNTPSSATPLLDGPRRTGIVPK